MSIRLCCPNGHTLEAPDRLAGTVIECPMCGEDIIVGPPPPVATLVTDPVPAPPVATLVVGPVSIPPPTLAGPTGEYVIPELSIEEDVGKSSERDRPHRPSELGIEEDEKDEGEPSERRRPHRRSEPRTASRPATISEKMRRVNIGLTFFYAKFILMVVALLLNILTNVGVALSKSPDGGVVFEYLQRMAMFFQTCLGLTGAIFLCFVPRKTRLRPLAITSAALEGGGVFLIFLGVVLLMARSPAGLAIMLLGALSALGAWITFMVFLSNLAKYLDDEPTAAQVMQLMWMVIVAAVCVAVLAAGLGVAMKTSPAGRAIIFLGLGILFLAIHIKFLIGMLAVLGTMRQQIATRW